MRIDGRRADVTRTEQLISFRMPAIKSLNNEISAGLVRNPKEAMNVDLETSADVFHLLFKKVWKEDYIIQDWKEGFILKLPKNGDLNLYIPGKLFNEILLEGFKKDKSCLDHIAVIVTGMESLL